jgi:hypothetical protein
LKIKGVDAAAVKTMAEKYHTNFRYFEDGTVGISLMKQHLLKMRIPSSGSLKRSLKKMRVIS